MKTIRWITANLLGLLALACANNALAQTVSISQAWVAATVTGQHASAAFLTLQSDQPVTLLSVSSSVAAIAQVHEMTMDNGIMRMHALEQLPLAANTKVELKPSGNHIMLMDLKQALTVGNKVKLVLKFKTAHGKVIEREVQADVRDRARMAM